MKRNKTIQITLTEEQKHRIEMYVLEKSKEAETRFTISTFLLKLILTHIDNEIKT